jgi:hypothetical protein
VKFPQKRDHFTGVKLRKHYFTGARDRVFRERESAEDLDVDRTPYCDYNDHIRGIRRMQL